MIIADEMENPSLVAGEFTKNEIMNRIRMVGDFILMQALRDLASMSECIG